MSDVELRIIADFAGPAGAYALGRVTRRMMHRESSWRYRDGTTKLLHNALLSSALDVSLTRVLRAQNFPRRLLDEMDVAVVGSVVTQAMMGVVWPDSDVNLVATFGACVNCTDALIGAGFICDVSATITRPGGLSYSEGVRMFNNTAGERAVDLALFPWIDSKYDEMSPLCRLTQLSDLVICASCFDGKRWRILDPRNSLYGVTRVTKTRSVLASASEYRARRREKYRTRGVKFV